MLSAASHYDNLGHYELFYPLIQFIDCFGVRMSVTRLKDKTNGVVWKTKERKSNQV